VPLRYVIWGSRGSGRRLLQMHHFIGYRGLKPVVIESSPLYSIIVKSMMLEGLWRQRETRRRPHL
jgi:hypothetical protein